MSGNQKNIDLGNDKLKEHIFQAPNGYFDSLHDRIMANVPTQSNTSILDSPKLKENIFTVPEGYFDGLSQKIDESTSDTFTVKVIPLYQRNWVRYAAAAVVLIAVFVLGLKSDDVVDDWGQSLSDESIIEYLFDENLSSLDIVASVEDASLVLDQFINDELGTYSLTEFDNPELEYDFEYFEY